MPARSSFVTTACSIGITLLMTTSPGCGDDSGTDGGARDASGDATGIDAATDAATDAASDSGGDDGGGDAGGDDAAATDAGSTTECGGPGDCAWGEIDHEILTPADCPCLLGCPTIPMNRTTVERRQMQYESVGCNPSMDGMGNPCPVDDCVTPPPLLCTMGECVAPPADGG